MVILTQPSLTWEETLNWGIIKNRLAWEQVCGRLSWLLIAVGRCSPLWAASFPRKVLDCVSKLSMSPHVSQQTLLLHCFCFKLFLKFLFSLPSGKDCGLECKLKKPFPHLSRFWSVFYHHNRKEAWTKANWWQTKLYFHKALTFYT